jgi:hypothetical protein
MEPATGTGSLLVHRKAIAWIETHGGDEGAILLAEVRAWLKDAVAYEDIHVVDSMLDRSDPFVRDVIIPAKERLRERRLRRCSAAGTTASGIACPTEYTG